MNNYIQSKDAMLFLKDIPTNSVDLVLTDPPYFGIVKEHWDNNWKSIQDYSKWLSEIVQEIKRVLTPTGSLLMFHCVGKDKEHPIFQLVSDAEKCGLTYRNWLTWKKRRGYGKSHDYLFLREEILWFSKSSERTEITFNIPLTNIKRGYAGFNPDYPAKSEYKRVGNVMVDLWDYPDTLIEEPELMRPQRNCQKPEGLLTRLVETHSNPGQLVVDCFAGYGSTGIVALKLGRKFSGCEGISQDAQLANDRCVLAAKTCSLGSKDQQGA